VDAALPLPRRDSPRVRVPAGAVAIADRYSGIYPRPAPSGWHILGHTDTPMWTLEGIPRRCCVPAAACGSSRSPATGTVMTYIPREEAQRHAQAD
jgi:allophanate hydrolase subunit 1